MTAETPTQDRGLAFAILFEFVLALAVFGLAWGVLNDPAQQFLGIAAQQAPQGTEQATGLGYIEAMWNFLPVFFAAATVLFLQARAAFESRGGVS